MKKVLVIGSVISALLLSSCQSTQQAFFNNEKYEKELTTIQVPMVLVNAFMKKKLSDEKSSELSNLLQKTSSVKLVTSQNPSKSLQKDVKRYLASSSLNDFMTYNNKGNEIGIKTVEKGSLIKNFILNVNSPNGLYYVDVKGNYTPEDLNRLTEFLEKEDITEVLGD